MAMTLYKVSFYYLIVSLPVFLLNSTLCPKIPLLDSTIVITTLMFYQQPVYDCDMLAERSTRHSFKNSSGSLSVTVKNMRLECQGMSISLILFFSFLLKY